MRNHKVYGKLILRFKFLSLEIPIDLSLKFTNQANKAKAKHKKSTASHFEISGGRSTHKD